MYLVCRMKRHIVKMPVYPQDTHKYLCPIGHDDPEVKHFHKSSTVGLFSHSEIFNHAAIVVHFDIRRKSKYFPDTPEPDTKSYSVIAINITGLGGGIRPNYWKKKISKEIGHYVKDLLRESFMVRDA